MDDALRLRARAARARIESGALRGAALLELLLEVPFRDRDAWVDELLGLAPPPPDIPDLPRDSVPYLPCGVEEIVAVVREAPLRADDVLVDLGSGLGKAVILGHLLSGARALGIELQEHLVRSARASCAALALPSVSFVHGDVSEAAFDGTVFFLYAPFNGATLARVVRRLAEVARRRAIVVCAVGLELPLPLHGGALVQRTASCAAMTLYDARLRLDGGGG